MEGRWSEKFEALVRMSWFSSDFPIFFQQLNFFGKGYLRFSGGVEMKKKE